MQTVKKNLNLLLLISSFLFISVNGFSKQMGTDNNLQASVNTKYLQGVWMMAAIKTDEMVEIKETNLGMEPVKTEEALKKAPAKIIKVPLKSILEKQMSVGITKFIFTGQNFQFYRNKQLTFSGTWDFDASTNKLVLKYKSGKYGDVSTKENKIILLSGKELSLESESYNKNVTFAFVKK